MIREHKDLKIMRIKTLFASLLLTAVCVHAQDGEKQTVVNMSSHSFNDGVHTTFTVEFPGMDDKNVEAYWKKQLKDMYLLSSSKLS